MSNRSQARCEDHRGRPNVVQLIPLHSKRSFSLLANANIPRTHIVALHPRTESSNRIARSACALASQTIPLNSKRLLLPEVLFAVIVRCCRSSSADRTLASADRPLGSSATALTSKVIRTARSLAVLLPLPPRVRWAVVIERKTPTGSW